MNTTTFNFDNLLLSTGASVFIMLFLVVLWIVLVIALFFKVWGMTDNVKEIKEMMKGYLEHKRSDVSISTVDKEGESGQSRDNSGRSSIAQE